MTTALEGRADAVRAHETDEPRHRHPPEHDRRPGRDHADDHDEDRRDAPPSRPDRPGDHGLEQLWSDYRRHGTPRLRDRLVAHYISTGHVRKIAARLHASLPQQVDLEDLVQQGCLGLMDAIKRFDTTRDTRFETFSGRRIYGAMQDYLRDIDPVPRLTRSRSKKLDRHIETFRARHGRPPDDDELRSLADLPERVFRKLRQSARPAAMVPFSNVQGEGDFNEDDTDAMAAFTDGQDGSPHDHVEHEDLRRWVVRGLSRRDQLIITLYYYEEMTMREVGDALGISESRVSQRLDEILGCLRARLCFTGAEEEFH